MTDGARLGAMQQVHENLTLFAHPILEIRGRNGGLDGIETGTRSGEGACLRLHHVTSELQQRLMVGVVHRTITQEFRRLAFRDDSASELFRARDKIAVDDAVEEAGAGEIGAARTGSPETIMLIAVSSPTARGRSLGSTGAGNEADLHLGKTDFRIRGRDPVVTGERQLEPATQGAA